MKKARGNVKDRIGPFAAGLVACLVCAAGCGRPSDKGVPAGKKGSAAAVPVTTAFVEEKPVELKVHAIGTVEPIETVSIRAQVGGALTNIAFNEGDDVQAGQLLFELDRRPLEAEVRRQEATSARDQAQFDNSERQAKRYAELAQKDFVTQSQYEDVRTSAEVLAATVKVDKEALKAAQLQMGYATIRAPISGRVGGLSCHVGDVIKANDAALVVINRIRPILVRFAVPAVRLPEVQKYGTGTNLIVVVRLPGEAGESFRGVLCFVDNAVDETTGTILLKARFDNADNALWPGQFVDVDLVLNTEWHAVTVPSAAVQPGQDGLLAFVVKPDMTVEKRVVEIRRTADGLDVIGKGLSLGEQVVTDGQLRLVPGAKVELRAGAQADKAKP